MSRFRRHVTSAILTGLMFLILMPTTGMRLPAAEAA